MKPEEAQEQTEKRWLLLIRGGETTACGWCMFANDVALDAQGHPGGPVCNYCPIKVVFGSRCGELQAYNDWQYSDRSEGRADLARVIYDLLIAYRQQLIAAGEEIQSGQSDSDDRGDDLGPEFWHGPFSS